MSDEAELNRLDTKLSAIVHGTCNVVGCCDCKLKSGDTCQANALQDEIYAIRFKESD